MYYVFNNIHKSLFQIQTNRYMAETLLIQRKTINQFKEIGTQIKIVQEFGLFRPYELSEDKAVLGRFL